MQMDAKFAVRDHVVEALRNEVHRLQQYTRRYSVAVVGIDKKRNETDESLREEVLKLVADVNSTSKEEDIDKFHRNGRLFNGKDQEIIIRFKSHAAKEAFYRARKNLPPSRKSRSGHPLVQIKKISFGMLNLGWKNTALIVKWSTLCNSFLPTFMEKSRQKCRKSIAVAPSSHSTLFRT